MSKTRSVIEDMGRLRPAIVVDRWADEPSSVDDLFAGEFEGEHVVVIARLRELVTKLAQSTDWHQDTLLDNIGCPARSNARLLKDLSRLRACESFLSFLWETAEVVSTTVNCRAFTMTSADLLKHTELGPDELRELFHSGDPSPWMFVELGEIAEAARVARLNANLPRPGDDDRRGPAADEAAVHISTTQLDSLLRGETRRIGAPVFDAMTTHIEACRVCAAAADRRREQLGI